MRNRLPLLSLALAAALLFACVFAPTEASSESDVLVLTKSNFEESVKDEKIILVEFYAPWCGHCKALAPEYEKAATSLKSNGIPLAKVDCTAEEEVCSEHGVKGYPTLKVFRSGSPTDYNGARQADGIVSYMKKQLLPAVSEITLKNAESFIDSEKVVVVGFFKSTDSEEYKALVSAANVLRDEFLFGATVDEAVVSKYEATTPSVILFKKFDEGKSVYPAEGESFSVESLSSFVQVQSLPLVDQIAPENYGKYVKTGLPLLYLFVSSPEELAKYKPSLESVAAGHRGKINFVHIDANKFAQHGQDLGVSKFPGLVIHINADNLKYVFDKTKAIVQEELSAWVEAFTKGELKPHFKSQDEPEEPFEGNVRVVVGSNFKEVVLDSSKDVFVEFYAPWCGHCKKLAPTWESLGESYESHRDKVVIAKMDATANDIPPESPFKEIQGFPTIVLFKAGSKEVVNYEGDRSFANLVEFLEGNIVNKTGVTPEDPEEKSTAPHDEL
ncbi:protein disulfide isomerase [Gonapodya prolifera JEL478]|uniref:Protein disulfide-isomerase n=1 Tax=Gonapodya prolifera (strain JEL478) TaxID=1344416 RepID=A0A139AGV2_GONPJ|nr:protein disulfide isomerase [Gonapodya prolifera JEL478]|eukprot:KXS15919.1 protein disulfide isomerase [Gonapodya prolifera JEL478]